MQGEKRAGARRLFSPERTGEDPDAVPGPGNADLKKNIPGLVSFRISTDTGEGDNDVQSPIRKEIYLIAYR